MELFTQCADCRTPFTCLNQEECKHSLDSVAKANETARIMQKATPPEIEELQKIANGKNAQRLAEGFKENNPKDAFGILKACMSWVPQTVIMELALAMAEGGFKYGGHNYLVAAPRSSVYTDGAERHIYQYVYEGDLDEESKVGLHHISKAIASLVVLRAAQINGHWIDDRPPQAPKGWLASLNAKMIALSKAFPQPVARYLKEGKRGPGRILEDA